MHSDLIKTQTRNIGIDILRGISVLTVILLHLNIHFHLSDSFIKELLPKKLFSLLFWSGYYGVIMFFTISGYLITNSIINKWGQLSKINIKTFYWFRFSRIIPPLAGLLFILSVLHLTGLGGFVINPKQTTLPNTVLSALSFCFNWLEIKVGYLPGNWDVLWTISIEEVFYLVFPLICLFLKKEERFLFLLIIFLIISPWARTHLLADNELGDRNNLAYLDTISIGCMAAIVSNKFGYSKLIYISSLVIGWALVIFTFLFRKLTYESGITGMGLDITMLSIGVGFIIFWMHENNRSGSEKNRTLLNWIKHMGVYSYEIYLTHMFVVIAAVKIFNYFDPGETYLWPSILIAIFACYLLGKMVFKYYSEPLNIRLRKKRVNLKDISSENFQKKS